jgi:hypothetical protein
LPIKNTLGTYKIFESNMRLDHKNTLAMYKIFESNMRLAHKNANIQDLLTAT